MISQVELGLHWTQINLKCYQLCPPCCEMISIFQDKRAVLPHPLLALTCHRLSRNSSQEWAISPHLKKCNRLSLWLHLRWAISRKMNVKAGQWNDSLSQTTLSLKGQKCEMLRIWMTTTAKKPCWAAQLLVRVGWVKTTKHSLRTT